MTFKKYLHVEHWGNDEVQNVELGKVYLFSKLDGTNGIVWLGEDEHIHAGSRNRELTLEKDNRGFFKYILKQKNYLLYLKQYPDHILYMEWLIPHALRTYKDDAWNKAYIIDVFSAKQNKYLSYDEYKPLLDEFNLRYIPCQAIIENGTYEQFVEELNKNAFLIKDGEGIGEGIVLKNYEFKNMYSRQCFAKLITSDFKTEKYQKNTKLNNNTIEQVIVDKYITVHFIDKVYYKIRDEYDGWQCQYISRLLNTTYHDLIIEEMWDILKRFKNPTINFKTLRYLVIQKIKAVKPELF